MYSRIVHGTAYSGIDFFGGRRNGAGPAKAISSRASFGVEPTNGNVLEDRAAGKRIVRGAWGSGIHML